MTFVGLRQKEEQRGTPWSTTIVCKHFFIVLVTRMLSLPGYLYHLFWEAYQLQFPSSSYWGGESKAFCLPFIWFFPLVLRLCFPIVRKSWGLGHTVHWYGDSHDWTTEMWSPTHRIHTRNCGLLVLLKLSFCLLRCFLCKVAIAFFSLLPVIHLIQLFFNLCFGIRQWESHIFTFLALTLFWFFPPSI